MGFLLHLLLINGLALLVCLVQAEVHYHDFVAVQNQENDGGKQPVSRANDLCSQR
ncbi:hypothetical protein Pint_07851 [Pistacia integerrima]|uniref:Uncharacterized protein n=1 Tax=Pistacia integerrima TaxID=434235 RepID=A0ACC0XWB0_9ROSI|nr:hypothetical protein Pint_07851 [Pistacia integerrima]